MFNQKKYINQFNKDTYKNLKIRIRKDDKIVMAKLANVKSFNGYIRYLIYKDALNRQDFNFINNDIKIDFEISNTMKNLIDKAEEADYLNDYGLYMNVADAIDTQAKKETTNHIISESEWKKLTMRYAI